MKGHQGRDCPSCKDAGKVKNMKVSSFPARGTLKETYTAMQSGVVVGGIVVGLERSLVGCVVVVSALSQPSGRLSMDSPGNVCARAYGFGGVGG
jgi:hypothetical protein